MNKRSYRRFTTDEKRMILTEVQQPGVTLSEVCRKHSVSPALVYRWRAVAQQATTQALQKLGRAHAATVVVASSAHPVKLGIAAQRLL